MRYFLAAALAAITLGPATAAEDQSLESLVEQAITLTTRINAMECVVDTLDRPEDVRDFSLAVCYLFCGTYADEPIINTCMDVTVTEIESLYPGWVERFEGGLYGLSETD